MWLVTFATPNTCLLRVLSALAHGGHVSDVTIYTPTQKLLRASLYTLALNVTSET